jgi:hypothetical protein
VHVFDIYIIIPVQITSLFNNKAGGKRVSAA